MTESRMEPLEWIYTVEQKSLTWDGKTECRLPSNMGVENQSTRQQEERVGPSPHWTLRSILKVNGSSQPCACHLDTSSWSVSCVKYHFVFLKRAAYWIIFTGIRVSLNKKKKCFAYPSSSMDRKMRKFLIENYVL